MAVDDLVSEANWMELRDAALPAQDSTELVTTEQTRVEFVEGARLLRLGEVFPQQLVIADTLNAGRESNAIEIPRRATKSTSVQAVILGRCTVREDYVAAFTTVTKGSKARQIFRRDVLAPIARVYPDEGSRPMDLRRGNGTERIEWPNGSVYTVETPIADSFRGGAYDLVLLDEAGEAELAQGEDLLGGVMSTFDTRDGQVVFAGTPGDYRDGNLLWDALHDSAGARLRYGIDPDTAPELLDSWETVLPLVLATHPGVACGLTPIEKVHARYDKLGPARFAREYLGVWGDVGGGKSLLRADKWAEAGTDAPLPSPPERFGLAYAVHAELPRASVVAAWRDERGRGYGLLLKTFHEYTGIPGYLQELFGKYGMPVAFDPHFGFARTVKEHLERARPKPHLVPATANDVKTAAALLVRDVHEGKAVHFNQAELNESARTSVARKIGVGGFSFGRVLAEDDPTPLEAWALALKLFDDRFLKPMDSPDARALNAEI